VRFPQIIVYETDGTLGRTLRPLAKELRWLLREPRKTETCARLLKNGGPAVLVLRIARDLVRELGLVESVAQQFSEARVVAICDADHPTIAALAWDLGASYVITPPQPPELLRGAVSGLMPSAVGSKALPRAHSGTTQEA
jgi:DNA-binding NarL/FixJ family response regulator